MPLYESVAARIMVLMDEGTFSPGERVPSIRTLSCGKHWEHLPRIQSCNDINDPVDLVPSPKQTNGGDFFENSSKKVTFQFLNPNVDHMYPF